MTNAENNIVPLVKLLSQKAPMYLKLCDFNLNALLLKIKLYQ